MSDKTAFMMSGISEFLEQEETDRLVELALSDVDPDPEQDRHNWDHPDTIAHLESMTVSVRAGGVRRPIEVYEHEPGRYKIIAGEIRYRASVNAEREVIPALLRLKTDEKQRSLDMLTENFSRLGLMPMELARALKRRIDGGITRDELIAATGKDKAWLSRLLGLLELPEDVQDFAESGKVRDPARLHSLAKIDKKQRGSVLEDLATGNSTVGDVLVAHKSAAAARYKKSEKKRPAKKKPFAVDLTATKNEARLLVAYFHPDWDCDSDEALDGAFKKLMGEFTNGVHTRPGDGADSKEN